jgi:hypothetical protein
MPLHPDTRLLTNRQALLLVRLRAKKRKKGIKKAADRLAAKN